jgi:putative nucleotidyltransferase with HDIG domain
MTLYRVKQFYWSITSRVSAKDEEFIKEYLNAQEICLFQKLPDYEKMHAIKVAKDVEKLYNGEEERKVILMKAALLHDIGKASHRLTPVNKSVIVILDSISSGRIKKYDNIKKINVYYNHADIGYNMLKKFGYEERFLYLIKNHHNDNIIGDKELDILKKCDSRN